MMNRFFNLMQQKKLVLADGAMGTELIKRGLKPGEPPESWNVKHPEVVLGIQRKYVEAGAEIILTNTFGGNRLKLRRAGMETKWREFNLTGVKITQEAARNKVLVAGDMGPTGEFLYPYGDYQPEDILQVYAEQVQILVEEGVDLIVIQTMSDLRELQTAVQACRQYSSIPVAACVSFSRRGSEFRTFMGATIPQVVNLIKDTGTAVLGTNCGDVTPQEMSLVIGEMTRLTSCPLIAKPNAGLPLIKEGETIYPLSPEEFSRAVQEIVEAGAKIIGGCCGTSPEHIRVLRTHLEKKNLV